MRLIKSYSKANAYPGRLIVFACCEIPRSATVKSSEALQSACLESEHMSKLDRTFKTEIIEEAKRATELFGFTAGAVTPTDDSLSTFRVQGTRSDETISLFLKRVAENNLSEPCANTDLQRWLCDNLVKNGFGNVPEFHASTDGSCMVLLRHVWSCQNFVDSGDRYDWLNFDCPSRLCYSAGSTLGRLHYAGAQIVRRNPGLRAFVRTEQIIRSMPQQLEQTAYAFSKYKVEPGFSLMPELELLRAINFQRIVEQSSLLSVDIVAADKNSRPTINHGDFHCENVLATNTSIDCVIDWDYASVGGAVYDLAYALFLFCLQPIREGAERGELFSQRKMTSFLEGYGSTHSTLKSMDVLSQVSEFMFVLMLDWACQELMKSDSKYANHQGFKDFVRTLAYCCS